MKQARERAERCLRDAVYPIDWSGITDRPVMRTIPMHAGGDAGPDRRVRPPPPGADD